MIGLIVTALLQTFCALDQEDDSGYAFHCGEAGGIAAATAAFGVRALELCDDISDAYEDSDLDFMRYILRYTPDADGYSFDDTAIGEAAQASFHRLASGYRQQEPEDIHHLADVITGIRDSTFCTTAARRQAASQKLDAKTKTVAVRRRNPVKFAGHRSWVSDDSRNRPWPPMVDENRNCCGGRRPRTNWFT